jgi:hypothetical protein
MTGNVAMDLRENIVVRQGRAARHVTILVF